MSEKVWLPVRKHNGENWAELSATGASLSHDICGEKVQMRDEKFSFIGGHRVRLYSFKKNVHWKIPAGITLDISLVPPAQAPRRVR